MTIARALNSLGNIVCATDVSNIDEALTLAYNWNSDEERPKMIVSTVECEGFTVPIAVQTTLFSLAECN